LILRRDPALLACRAADGRRALRSPGASPPPLPLDRGPPLSDGGPLWSWSRFRSTGAAS